MCLAVPGKVVEILPDDNPTLRRAKVDFAGIRKEICLAFTPDAEVGQYVLVHVGFALSVVGEDEANRVVRLLNQAGDWE
jgi:hydrogenase expression/formation protein HypC